MGKAKDGIFGPFTGKVGNVVGYYSNGQHILRGVPGKRSKKKVSLAEKNNQKKFALVQAWLKPFSYFLKVGFKNYGTKTGGYRAAVSYTLLNAVAGEHPNCYIDPALVKVSGGDLGFPAEVSMVLEADEQLRFNWSAATENGDPYDQAMLLAYNIEKKTLAAKETAAFRQTGTDVLQLCRDKVETSFHVYIGFVAQDRSCQSHSKYLGKVTIPGK